MGYVGNLVHKKILGIYLCASCCSRPHVGHGGFRAALNTQECQLKLKPDTVYSSVNSKKCAAGDKSTRETINR